MEITRHLGLARTPASGGCVESPNRGRQSIKGLAWGAACSQEAGSRREWRQSSGRTRQSSGHKVSSQVDKEGSQVYEGGSWGQGGWHSSGQVEAQGVEAASQEDFWNHLIRFKEVKFVRIVDRGVEAFFGELKCWRPIFWLDFNSARTNGDLINHILEICKISLTPRLWHFHSNEHGFQNDSSNVERALVKQDHKRWI